jgi:glyoxylase-like metal-dependent hydrolase (beta-lactamase superfamily II)
VKEGSYRFDLGDFKCVSLADGTSDYGLEQFFKNVPKEEVEAELRKSELPTDHITTPYTYLLVDAGEHRVLADMGAGNLRPTTGKLVQNMRAASIDPDSIDTVVITHAHPDHIGGTLDSEGNPVYANAAYYISEREWDFWFSESAIDQAFPGPAAERFVTTARKNLKPLEDRTTLLEFVDGESEIIDGISAIEAPGHTPGHMVVCFVSGNERLYYIGDTVLYPFHLEHPDWLPIFDILPDEAEPSKHKIFDRVAEEKAWVVGQHFPPFPGLGHVVKKGAGWQWQPVEA